MHAETPSTNPSSSAANPAGVGLAPDGELATADRAGVDPRRRRTSRMLWRARRNVLSWVGAGIVLLLLGVGIFGEYIAPYPQDAGRVVRFQDQLKPPSPDHLMGTDDA